MRRSYGVGAGVAVVFGLVVASRWPLSFPDFPFFADRARLLSHGDAGRLADALYPVGYPLVLLMLKLPIGDGLLAGRLLSAAAAVALVVFVAEAGEVAAMTLLFSAGLAAWGPTEGTDIVAAAGGIAAILLAERRPGLAGALAAAAALTRYPAVAVLPVVFLLSSDRRRSAVGPLVALGVHLLGAAVAGGPYLPDQERNMAIGGAASGLLTRWPVATAHGAFIALSDPVAAAALLVALVGLAGPRDRRVLGLLGAAALHIGVLGLAFANPRLALPATLAVVVAGGLTVDRWLERKESSVRRGLWLGLAAGIMVLGARLWGAAPGERERSRDAIIKLARQEPLASSSPDVAVWIEGWPLPCQSIVEARSDDPAAVAAWLDQHGFTQVILEDDRVRHQWRGLRPLLSDAPPGFELVAERGGWRLLSRR